MIHVMRFVLTWSITQKTGLLMTRHRSTNISSRFAQRFFTLTFRLYNKYHTCRDHCELYVNIRTALWGIFFGVSRHRIDTNQPVHICWLKLLISVIFELSCMKLIARAEQIGLTWPGTTRRARSILQQPKAQQNHCTSIENQLQMHCYFTYFNIRGIVKVAS